MGGVVEEKVILSREEYDLLVAKANQHVFTVTKVGDRSFLSSYPEDTAYDQMSQVIKDLKEALKIETEENRELIVENNKLYNRPTWDMFRSMNILEFIKWKRGNK